MASDFRLPARSSPPTGNRPIVPGPSFPETGTAGPVWSGAPDLQPFLVPIASLRPAPDNARAHGERDIAAVAASLRAHGQRKAIVPRHNYRGLSNVVLAGNGTLQAAIRLGWTHVAVAWYDEGTDDEAREYAIRDNRTAELSAWDPAQLAALTSEGIDLLALGWRGDELGDLLALAGSDAVPDFQPAQPVGRLDQLQPHCATCRCREAG